MPAALVAKLADTTGIDIAEAEKRWKKSKLIAGENGLKESNGEDFWKYVTGVFKKSIGIGAVMEAATAEEIHAAAHEAATSHLNDLPEPTQAQLEAGNYKKGKIRLHGMEITIENPKGSKRSGIDPDGTPWEVEMPYTYGYINRTLAKDGDHIDCCIGEHPESELVFLVDQVDAATQKYDEPKVLFGTLSRKDARALYISGFSDGKGVKRLGAMTAMHMPDFRTWLDGDTTKPLSDDVMESAVAPRTPRWATKIRNATSVEEIAEVFREMWPGVVTPAPTTVMPPAVQGMKSMQGGKGLPNTVYRDIYHLYEGTHLDTVTEPYDGTLEGLMAAWKNLQLVLNDYQDASNAESPIAATDASGRAKYYISPNGRWITDLQSGAEINTDDYQEKVMGR